ncbi:hypothetical protein BDB01DRAFT_315438 [Pilobolus umbonatus]|nr:hypothetical protein BDB01DRAFT_315438 [Pilobolus umbonatus]
MLILHLGLLVISPASLELIIPCSSNITIANEDVQIYVNQPYLYLPNKLIPPNISGLKTYGHIASYSFSLASMHLQPPSISHVCPDYANSCTFKDIQFISTSFACKEVTENEPILDKNYNYSTISHYLQQSTSGFPHFFFAGDMHQRTSHDLYDYTLPITSEEIATILSNTTYDTYYRHYVGEQAFVMAYSSKGINVDTAQKSDIIYQKCHFTSRINNSTWQTKNGVLTNIAEESIPIEMDYDGIIGNNSALNSQTKEIAIMVNAYSMQQSLLNELVLPNYSNMKEYLTRCHPLDQA